MLDILRHMPRSIFSDKQTSAICWAMSSLGVPSLPSQYILKNSNNKMHDKYGIRTIRYNGALGHIYYANDLLQIIAQVRYSVYLLIE